MITTITQARTIAKKFNALKTDKDRLIFLKYNNEDLMISVDKEETYVGFIYSGAISDQKMEDIMDVELTSLDETHGMTEGTVHLFEFAGITAEIFNP